MKSGRIEVITGPMFSGKSEELIRRLRRATFAKQRIQCFKPNIDNRYNVTDIASHSKLTFSAKTVQTTGELKTIAGICLNNFDVIGIDEAQFFGDELISFSIELARAGKRVIIAGLDTTFAGEPFHPIPELMAIADEVIKLSAVCVKCGEPAIHSQRLSTDTSRVLVGADTLYEARCRQCFDPILES
jgi:thymidine kinase